jgi:hypothetical protein
MAVKYFDRVKETTTTTGTSDAALAGAASGYRAFSSVLSDGDLCYYCMEVASGGAWEMGIGTYSSMGSIARTVILSSSNSNSIVSFSAGTKKHLHDRFPLKHLQVSHTRQSTASGFPLKPERRIYK